MAKLLNLPTCSKYKIFISTILLIPSIEIIYISIFPNIVNTLSTSEDAASVSPSTCSFIRFVYSGSKTFPNIDTGMSDKHVAAFYLVFPSNETLYLLNSFPSASNVSFTDCR